MGNSEIVPPAPACKDPIDALLNLSIGKAGPSASASEDPIEGLLNVSIGKSVAGASAVEEKAPAPVPDKPKKLFFDRRPFNDIASKTTQSSSRVPPVPKTIPTMIDALLNQTTTKEDSLTGSASSATSGFTWIGPTKSMDKSYCLASSDRVQSTPKTVPLSVDSLLNQTTEVKASKPSNSSSPSEPASIGSKNISDRISQSGRTSTSSSSSDSRRKPDRDPIESLLDTVSGIAGSSSSSVKSRAMSEANTIESLLDGSVGNSLVSGSTITRSPFANKRAEYVANENAYIKPMRVKTLMRGRDLLEPLDTVLGLKEFTKTHPSIDRYLRSKGMFQLNSLQRCVSQHVLRGRNCTIVGGIRDCAGKTLSYLLPMACLALDDVESLKAGWKASDILFKVKKGARPVERIGPVGLIICASSQSGQKIRQTLEPLIAGSVYVTCFTNGTESNLALKKELELNPEFLIVTADFALQLFDLWFKFFRFERLRFLVFDDTHLMFEKNYKEVEELLSVVHHHIEREGIASNVQTIYCGQEWNDKIASATVKTTENNILFIGAPLEAIKYAGHRGKVHFVHPDDKLQALADLFEKDKTGYRTIIFCNDDETTAERIAVKLSKDKSIVTRPLPRWGSGAEAVIELRNFWKEVEPKENAVIVITDNEFRDLEINDALAVIHYDLPEKKKEGFGDRYMAMWAHFPDITNYETEGDAALDPKIDLDSHVLITAEDKEMYKIVLQLESINFEIPKNLLTLAKQEEKLALAQINTICTSLLNQGRCSSAICKLRHVLTVDDFEKEPNVPRTGQLEVKIVEAEDVNVYIAMINNYYEIDRYTNQKKNHISYANLGRSLQGKLNSYFADPSKLVPVEKLEIGKTCIIKFQNEETEYPNGRYLRGRMGKASLMDFAKNPLDSRVYCIDVGFHVVRRKDEVYVLPEEFQTQKSICVTLILANLKPRAEEAFFPDHARRKTKHLVEKDKCYSAKIAFSLGDKVWALPMVEHSRSPSGDWLLRSNVRHDIIKRIRAADDNPKHLEVLYKLCQDVGFDTDVYKPSVVIDDEFERTHFIKGGKIQWAFLPEFREEADQPLTTVWVSSVSSSIIYVSRDEFRDKLSKIDEELKDHITLSIQETYPNYDTIFASYYEPGMVVAVEERVDHVWNRGIIIKMYEHDQEVLFDIFFVDYGDILVGATMKELHPIPRKFVERLPFQIIGIRLEHLLPLDADLAELKDDDDGLLIEAWEFKPEVGEYLQTLLLPNSASTSLDIAPLRERDNLVEGGVRVCRSYDSFALKDDKELGEYLVEQHLAEYRANGREAWEDCKALLLAKWNRLANQHMAVDAAEEDEPDDEDFDYYPGSGFSMDVARETLLGIGCPAELVDVLSAATAAKAQAKSMLPAEEPGSLAEAEPKSSEDNKNKATGATESQKVSGFKSDLITPRIEWTDDDFIVTIRIFVPDTQEYSFTVFQNNRHVNFATKSKGKTATRYGFQFDLYGKAEEEILSKVMTGQYLTVKLTKVTQYLFWERLQHDTGNCCWIKRLDMDSDVEFQDRQPSHIGPVFRKRQQYAKKQAQKQRYRLPGASDESESEDENDKATQSDIEDDDDDDVPAPPFAMNRSGIPM